jgi:hypothetical protein
VLSSASFFVERARFGECGDVSLGQTLRLIFVIKNVIFAQGYMSIKTFIPFFSREEKENLQRQGTASGRLFEFVTSVLKDQ